MLFSFNWIDMWLLKFFCLLKNNKDEKQRNFKQHNKLSRRAKQQLQNSYSTTFNNRQELVEINRLRRVTSLQFLSLEFYQLNNCVFYTFLFRILIKYVVQQTQQLNIYKSLFNRSIVDMKGIQINNFFNNHISLNGKKINNQPNSYYKPSKPHPLVLNHNVDDHEPEETNQFDTSTPQMKNFKKDRNNSGRKKRTNTNIIPNPKSKNNRKSKEKKSSSFDQFPKASSQEKYHQKDTSQEQDFIKKTSKSYKKPKILNKQQKSNSGVKRSKSAIIKNTQSKTIVDEKQSSRQFVKESKKNIISSTQNSFKNQPSKKKLKKQTQILIDSKQQTERGQCRTARVQSSIIKSRQQKDKVSSQFQKSSQKIDRKVLKFQTQKKSTVTPGFLSNHNSAKNSKPTSARQKKVSKQLFNSKQKQSDRYDEISNLKKQDNQEVKRTLLQLHQALQNVNSKQALTKKLLKFTTKLQQVVSSPPSQGVSSESEQNEQNNEIFKRINNIKGNSQLKKQRKQKDQQENHITTKLSSKKLLRKKKQLKNINEKPKSSKQAKGIEIRLPQKKDSSHKQQKINQPWPFNYTQQEQSQYTSSNKQSTQGYYTKEQLQERRGGKSDGAQEQEILDQNNKNYMEFLRNLQSQKKQQEKHKIQFKKLQNNKIKDQKSDDLIGDINAYLNAKNISSNRQYESQKHSTINQNERVFNPILQRKRNQNIPIYSYEENQYLNQNNQSDNQQQSQSQIDRNKIVQIEKLKEFQRESDKMMKKIGNNMQDKKKNLILNLNSEQHHSSNIKGHNINNKSPSSPKYDDRYPHLVKSPKFSDVEITNILAVKQKFLTSKHQKMNQLIQKMYQKELVSPKSYEYSVYQLRKRFQEQSNGLEGFKEQASQILNQINQDKDQIKGIDQLIRQQKWDEARKLMKMDHRTASVFAGFKKNKDKIYDEYEGWQKVQINKKQDILQSPPKNRQIQVITNNICVTIQPSPTKIQPHEQNIQRGRLVREEPVIALSDSDENSEDISENNQSIQKRLDFQFDNRYKLKSNEDEDIKKDDPQIFNNLQQQFNDYLNVEKADSQDFQHYVYYQNEQMDNNSSVSENNSGLQEKKGKQLKEQGIFKLIQVPNGETMKFQNNELSQDNTQLDEQKQTLKFDNKKVIQIDESDIYGSKQEKPAITSGQNYQSDIIDVPNILNHNQQKQDEDNQSETNSLIELELRKGFESNLFFIKEYCISLCEYIRDNQQKKNQFKISISKSLQYDVVELLKKYRRSFDGNYNNDYNSSQTGLFYKQEFRKPPQKAISQQLAKQFNKTYTSLKFFNLDMSRKGRSKFQMENQSEKIFLAGILEVLNESLDFERPGSIFGKPLPWASSSKYLKNMKYLNNDKKKKSAEDLEQSAETYDFIFGVAIARIIQWGSCLCGFLPDTAQLQNTQIDDDYVVHIRQTRMAFLLQKMLAEEEATINNSELQETQIMLYLGKQIMQQLFHQTVQQISGLQQISSI